MARKGKQWIGEILVERGVVTQAVLVDAIAEAKSTGKLVGEVLVERGVCDETAIASALAKQWAVEFIDLSKPEALTKIDRSLVPEDLQKKFTVIPLRKDR
ncbi:MAG: hypothetical protein QM516_04885, partial [Limnohabitans sp.]|nr:hypothetical protein [Limnohabitans sp.]